jgi:hypothetical protein
VVTTLIVGVFGIFGFFISLAARLKRRTLTPNEIQQLKEITPQLKHGSSQLFRNLRDKGKNQIFVMQQGDIV